MPAQPTYPHFVYDARTRTHLRYNSPGWVFLAGESQLQVQHLSEPRLLHSAEASPCTEQAFREAAQAAYARVVLGPNQTAANSSVQYQRRREMPNAWYYQLLGPGMELRLNLSEYGGRGLNVNLLLEDMGTIPGLVVGPARSTDPRRVAIAAAEFQAALQRAVPALMAAAQGKPV